MKYRSLSFLIAVTVAASFISFGALTPNMVRAWKDFQVAPQACDWPHQMLTNLHWVWTTPVGFILGNNCFVQRSLSWHAHQAPCQSRYSYHRARDMGVMVMGYATAQDGTAHQPLKIVAGGHNYRSF